MSSPSTSPDLVAALDRSIRADTMRTFKTKYPATCAVHGADIPLGSLVHQPERGTILCHSCFEITRREIAAKTTPAATPGAPVFVPTGEQNEALELFATGKSLAIEAGAGTGKTSTLKLLAESTTKLGQYVAFNRAIVEESAGKMPANVSCKTAHALAMRAVGRNYHHRLDSKRMKSVELAMRLRLDSMTVDIGGGERKQIGASYLAGLVMRTIEKFCQTADLLPGVEHVPYIDGIDVMLGEGKRGYFNNDVVRQTILPAIRAAWEDLCDVQGQLPYRHSHYLKMWQLSDPKIGADFILFDEAQDASPVMVAIVAAQTDAQLVWVGDSQQQIYTFTGAVNALASVPAQSRTFLTQSFRFGPAIAEVANRILTRLGAELRVVGTDTIESTVCEIDKPDAILTRTNAAAVRAVLSAIKDGTKVHLVGGSKEIVAFAKAAQRLMDGMPTDHQELACFESWGEVQDYVEQDEQGSDLRLMVSLIDEFGVPTILEALDTMTEERDATLLVSTAHKAKGREWNRVKLAGDFPDDEDKCSEEEWRLMYVAVTRARRELDVTAVALLSSMQGDCAPVQA